MELAQLRHEITIKELRLNHLDVEYVTTMGFDVGTLSDTVVLTVSLS